MQTDHELLTIRRIQALLEKSGLNEIAQSRVLEYLFKRLNGQSANMLSQIGMQYPAQ